MKKYFSMLFLFTTFFLFTSENDRLTNYLSTIEKYKSHLCPLGDHKQGEIEIVLDIDKIQKIESIQQKRLEKAGFDKKIAYLGSRVGIVSEDNFWIWIRDAVIFPTGAMGTYDRLLWRSSLYGFTGVAILPILENGNILFNLNYRHATRSWELELPRGMIGKSETAKSAAIRELKEETGAASFEMIHLGNMTPDSGCLTTVVPIFFAKILKIEKSDQDFSEAISYNPILSLKEINQGLIDGFIMINGKKASLRDPFLTYSLYQAKIRNLIK
jgi:ADP-ribose pyrophosphatase